MSFPGSGQSLPIGGTITGRSRGEFISQNTFWYNGAANGIRPGFDTDISYNYITGQCWGTIQHDGAAIHLQQPSQPNAQVHHNWARDSPKIAIRFDGDFINNVGYNGEVMFNVGWNTTGIKIKGDNHTIYNNLALDKYDGPNPEPWGGFETTLLVYKRVFSDLIHNNFTVVINNGATDIGGGHYWAPGGWKKYPVPGILVENNYSGDDVADNVYDSGNLDFRPLEGSNFTNGDIIGPYLPGPQSFYWIPGRKLFKTSTPIPPTGATVGADRDVLMFLGAYRADYYHWFLGTNEYDVLHADVADSEYQGEIVEGVNVLVLPQLEADTGYYWRVDTQWGGYTYKGDVWSFVAWEQ